MHMCVQFHTILIVNLMLFKCMRKGNEKDNAENKKNVRKRSSKNQNE